MRYVARAIEKRLLRAAAGFPALLVTGPRRAGKTTLLRRLFPRATYVLLEDPAVIAQAAADPYLFLDRLRPPVILDEIQNTPQLLNYVRSLVDAAPRRMGRWLITGSQEIGLMQGVTESMAGRAAVFELLPFSVEESSKVSVLRGGYPEVLARPALASEWYRSYLLTYLERDVRAVSSIRNLATYRRFLALLASRCGQLLNKTDLAAPLGVSINTITEWLSILEVTGQILVVPPYFENFGKRLVKSPKVYFTDSGVACHLLDIDSQRALDRSPFRGPIFEGFVAAEIVKQQLRLGRHKRIYYFRDQRGLEVDFIVPHGSSRLTLIECKSAATALPHDGAPIERLRASMSRYRTDAFVVYQPARHTPPFETLRPGVRAVSVQRLIAALAE